MENLHLPGGYDKVLEDFAKKNNLAVKTAFYNLMDFIQLKDYSFSSVKIMIENPDEYLEEGSALEEREILLAFMESFGENTVGASVRGYYKRLNKYLILEIEYDDSLSSWEILSMFQRKIPSMEVLEDTLYLFYVKDIEEKEYKPESLVKISDLNEEEEIYTKAGYFDSIYVDEEEYVPEGTEEGE